jgi:DNA-directed RNA polymerase subunit N (RpoN/RPB10)
MDNQLIIDIDCYNCGQNISVQHRLGVALESYGYCSDCGEGVSIEFTSYSDPIVQSGTLTISRLPQE